MFRVCPTGSLKGLLGALLDFVYPPYCCLCGTRLQEGEKVVCEGCWGEVKPLQGPFCPNCGYPVKPGADECAMCQQRGWTFRQVGVLADFQPPVQQLIHLLKYKGKRSVGTRLGAMLSQALQGRPQWQRADLIIPVPLHRSRLRERGYNQSLLIAKALAERLQKPLRQELLVRRRNTRSQTKLNVAQRVENVSGAFQVKYPVEVREKRIILVDDVITTGATADACSRSLVNAGAKEVLVAAVATPINI
ncbi:MAG: ComF family protein [Candidatus Latescibacteria bacterium]|nr:ComF family protein [Candidatus Latescibacterota bacterium]